MNDVTERESHDDEDRKDSWWIERYHRHEIIALLMTGLALMILLALISYSPAQLPNWVGSNVSEENVRGNFVGPFGATISGYLLFALGAASFLLPAVIVMWAFQVLTTKRLFNTRNFIALGLFLLAAACLVDCQAFFFKDWITKYNLPDSTGGLLGNIIGQQLLVRLFGPAGSFIMMAIVAVLTLIIVTGIHPFKFTRMVIGKVVGFIRGINWEKEWSLWTGKPLQDDLPSYNLTTRILPANDVFTVDSIPSENFDTDLSYEEAELLFGKEDFSSEVDIEEYVEEDSYIAQPTLDQDLEEFDPIEIDQPEIEIEPEAEVEIEEPIPEPEIEPEPEPKPVAKPAPKPKPKAKPKPKPKAPPAAAMAAFQQPHHQPKTSANPHTLIKDEQFSDYELPGVGLLSYAKKVEKDPAKDDAKHFEIQSLIVSTLGSFKVEVQPGEITKGPTITRYEFLPSAGLRVNKITSLKDDIALATRAERINILAPIPGKNTVGIEIANSKKVTVTLRELFESKTFSNSKAKLPLVLGKNVYGKAIIGDLAKMPHLLVAGATGSGKSVCINSIIASLVYRYSPEDLKFIMIDPKVVEMQLYNRLPHMVMPVVTDSKKVILALKWVIREMENRYAMFAKKGVRNFEGYNSQRGKEIKAAEEEKEKLLQPNLFDTETGEDIFSDNGDAAGPETDSDTSEFPEKLPYIVVIIDELADLMQTAQADVETAIARLAQKARAAGIHLVIATQTPRADVITGTIKANIPSRIAFQVSSKTDSRIILDENGAENLIGKGDMLYLPPGGAKLIRAQGALITDEEALALVEACAEQADPKFEVAPGETADFGFLEEEQEEFKVSDADEEVLHRCMEVIYTEGKASTSLFQRKLRLGYTRAARMVDILESRGVIGPGDGAKPREILIDMGVSEPEQETAAF